MSLLEPFKPAPAKAAQRLDFRSAKVLVADDNAKSLELVCQVLMAFGIRTSSRCTNASEAGALLDRDVFDLAIIDGEMAPEDGFDLVRKVRASENPNRCMPMIIISGFTPERAILRARDIGANIVVSKPIVPKVLLSKIEWLARAPRQFINCDAYVGPDRRHRNQLPPGQEERRAESLRLTSEPARALSQDDIDSLFE